MPEARVPVKKLVYWLNYCLYICIIL